MKCLISKIIIDNREESGKELPGFVSAHLEKCHDCRAYKSLGQELRAGDPYSIISDSSMIDLNQKISASLNNNRTKKSKRIGIRLLSPVPIAALFFIVIISIGVLLFQGIGKPSGNDGRKILTNVTTAGNLNNLNDLFSKVESPIKREAEELKKSIYSAGEYLRSVMDFGLPGIPD